MKQNIHQQRWLPHVATVLCLLSYTLLAVLAPTLHDCACSRHAHAPMLASDNGVISGMPITSARQCQKNDGPQVSSTSMGFQLEAHSCCPRGDVSGDSARAGSPCYVDSDVFIKCDPPSLIPASIVCDRRNEDAQLCGSCAICGFLGQAQIPFVAAPPKLCMTATLWARSPESRCWSRELCARVRARSPPV